MTSAEKVLRRAADLFHEVGLAISAEKLAADCRNAILAKKLRENMRTSDQLEMAAYEGYGLCELAGVAILTAGSLDREHLTTVAEALRVGADLFREISFAIGAVNDEDRRSPDQLRLISANGFERCVRALAALGAKDVTIHECGKAAHGEEPWGEDEASRCTGTLVHDEYTACPVHDGNDRSGR